MTSIFLVFTCNFHTHIPTYNKLDQSMKYLIQLAFISNKESQFKHHNYSLDGKTIKDQIEELSIYH